MKLTIKNEDLVLPLGVWTVVTAEDEKMVGDRFTQRSRVPVVLAPGESREFEVRSMHELLVCQDDPRAPSIRGHTKFAACLDDENFATPELSVKTWWIGTIFGDQSNRVDLEALGVAILAERPSESGLQTEWDVRLSDEVLKRLDPLFGSFVWSLVEATMSDHVVASRKPPLSKCPYCPTLTPGGQAAESRARLRAEEKSRKEKYLSAVVDTIEEVFGEGVSKQTLIEAVTVAIDDVK